MNLIEAYKKLETLSPLFVTKDAASILQTTTKYASTILSRLAEKNMIVQIAQGRWSYKTVLDPLQLPSILTYPHLSYISLYTALYYHNLIEQIPSVIYCVSTTKTKQFNTPFAKVSIHHIESTLFNGYDVLDSETILMATPEKALFDTLYLLPARSRLFANLTEIHLPHTFNARLCKRWARLVKNPSRRLMIEKRLAELEI